MLLKINLSFLFSYLLIKVKSTKVVNKNGTVSWYLKLKYFLKKFIPFFVFKSLQLRLKSCINLKKELFNFEVHLNNWRPSWEWKGQFKKLLSIPRAMNGNEKADQLNLFLLSILKSLKVLKKFETFNWLIIIDIY